MHEIFLHQLGFPMTDPDVALVLRPEWAAKILNGSKTMELRGTATTKRCNVAIAVAGTGKLVGQVRITDSVLLARRNPQTGMLEDVSPNGLNSTQHMHLVYNHKEVLKYKRVHGWGLKMPRFTIHPEITVTLLDVLDGSGLAAWLQKRKAKQC